MSNWIKPSDLPKDSWGLHWVSYKDSSGQWSHPTLEYLGSYRGDWFMHTDEEGWQSEINDLSWRVMLIEAPEKPDDE